MVKNGKLKFQNETSKQLIVKNETSGSHFAEVFFLFFFHEFHQSVRVSRLILLDDLDLLEKLMIEQFFCIASFGGVFFKHFPEQISHLISKFGVILEFIVNLALSVFSDDFSFISSFKKGFSGQPKLEKFVTVCKR